MDLEPHDHLPPRLHDETPAADPSGNRGGAAASTTAFPLGAKTGDPLTMYLSDVCTIPTNLAGHPAVSVPFGTGDDGLPVGVQLLGPELSEGTLFKVAAVVEAAAPEPSRPAPSGRERS